MTSGVKRLLDAVDFATRSGRRIDGQRLARACAFRVTQLAGLEPAAPEWWCCGGRSASSSLALTQDRTRRRRYCSSSLGDPWPKTTGIETDRGCSAASIRKVLVTSASTILKVNDGSGAFHYTRSWVDAENNFDELKNQWGCGG